MQHGSRTKDHLIDWGWNYGEDRWMAHAWSKRGIIDRRAAHSLRWYKHQRSKKLRRISLRDLKAELDC